MADQFNLFNYYRRYRWTAANFTELQNSLIAESDGLAEGAYAGAVLEGLEVEASTGLDLSVSPGLAASPTGYLNIAANSVDLSLTAPSTSPKKSLVVIRPLLVQNTNITKPTEPFVSVPLKYLRSSEVVVIDGTESNTPEYPVKAADDVILAGVKLIPGQTQVTAYDLDFEVREILGAQSENLGQHILHNDNRLKPYRSSYKVLGIKPSQTSGSGPKLFSYPSSNTPSIFPQDASGNFNANDTLVDLGSGVISGGDAQSADFTPTIPTGNNSIVATVFLLSNDQINVAYGTEGSFQQCVDAIQNQVTTGAGCINPTQDNYKICYVIVTSVSGSISDIRVIDARLVGSNSAASGANPKIDSIYPFILGSPAQVVSGAATHSSLASIQLAASDGDPVIFLAGHTQVESFVQTKKLHINMNGGGVSGTFQFSTGSNQSSLCNGKVYEDITVDSGIQGCRVSVDLASGKTIISNATFGKNLLRAYRE